MLFRGNKSKKKKKREQKVSVVSRREVEREMRRSGRKVEDNYHFEMGETIPV